MALFCVTPVRVPNPTMLCCLVLFSLPFLETADVTSTQYPSYELLVHNSLSAALRNFTIAKTGSVSKFGQKLSSRHANQNNSLRASA